MFIPVISALLFASVSATPVLKMNDDKLLPNPKGIVNPPAEYVYQSEADFEFFNVVIQVENFEYALFGYGIDRWSAADFEAQNLTSADRDLIAFFQQQEVGHSQLVAGLMARPDLKINVCDYHWPNFMNILDFLDFNQKATRWGESGVVGYLQHLQSRPGGTVLTEGIVTEARQQFAFRQLSGYTAIDIWFVPGITPSMTWTLLAPYIKSCPKEYPVVGWNNFPGLTIENNPPAPGTSDRVNTEGYQPTSPGRSVNLSWENPGKTVGPFKQITRSNASAPTHVAWISQLGLVYTPLVVKNNNTGTTQQPSGKLEFNGTTYDVGAVNGTMFILLVDATPYVTPYNQSLIEGHIVAGPAEYQSG